jgi:hypothetical protein
LFPDSEDWHLGSAVILQFKEYFSLPLKVLKIS